MNQTRHSTLGSVLTASPTWEQIYDSAKTKESRMRSEYRTDPLPIAPAAPRPRIDRTDCRYLEAVPFKAHCYCNRLAIGVIVHEADCKKCKKYCPKSKSTNQ